jgi:hypothetical protein
VDIDKTRGGEVIHKRVTVKIDGQR